MKLLHVILQGALHSQNAVQEKFAQPASISAILPETATISAPKSSHHP